MLLTPQYFGANLIHLKSAFEKDMNGAFVERQAGEAMWGYMDVRGLALLHLLPDAAQGIEYGLGNEGLNELDKHRLFLSMLGECQWGRGAHMGELHRVLQEMEGHGGPRSTQAYYGRRFDNYPTMKAIAATARSGPTCSTCGSDNAE